MQNKGLGRDTKTGGNPSFQLYVLKLLNQIYGAILNNKVSSQIFVATPAQDTFTPVVPPNALTIALSGGATYSLGNGILSVSGGDVVFSMPFNGGEIVDIRTQ